MTGANRIPINSSNSNSNSFNGSQSKRKSVFSRIMFGKHSSGKSFVPLNRNAPGILGPLPGPPVSLRSSCSRCLGRGHISAFCRNRPRCQVCYHFGHVSSSCNFPPRLARHFGNRHSGNRTDITPSKSMTTGTMPGAPPTVALRILWGFVYSLH